MWKEVSFEGTLFEDVAIAHFLCAIYIDLVGISFGGYSWCPFGIGKEKNPPRALQVPSKMEGSGVSQARSFHFYRHPVVLLR